MVFQGCNDVLIEEIMINDQKIEIGFLKSSTNVGRKQYHAQITDEIKNFGNGFFHEPSVKSQ